ncbi:PREDICTED: protein-associating with the carboxyl-terminal domain of ezrin-like [Priapulus caudatus]|uniref:Protein-associating with the carboxyl-terminal domain of ezrin-like n=1 Tax=Priapulus caudatus TaxID=37621 RepID=A0ABM1DZ76_PRICU|nr:PREDICTED: protein-associating with the carboxyl-terminal domain of ezrin-like [Priapulus caudatus]
MGSEYSAIQDCKLDEPFETDIPQGWTLHPAVQKDGSKVSVFVHKKSDRRQPEYIENAAKQLKILRHPTILKFFASCQNVEGTFLITEQVKPLKLVLDALSAAEICAGLYNVLEAACFLHERGGVCHNNISVSSIYVAQDGSWRLGGVEHLCKFQDATRAFLDKCRPLRDPMYIAPEEKSGHVLNTLENGDSRDVYAFGVLANVMLDRLGELEDITTAFHNRIENEFLNPDPRQRPKLKSLTNDRIFRNEFLEVIKFLSQITIKRNEEKEEFFKCVVRKLYHLSPELVAARLAILLLTRFVVLDASAGEHLYLHLLTPGPDESRREYVPGALNPVLPTHLYKQYIIPQLTKMFNVRETHVRLLLLKHFSAYLELFPRDILRQVILPQLLLGLKDYNENIVAASLRGLADIVPLVGAESVIGGQQSRYFFEGQPKKLVLGSASQDRKKKSDSIPHLTAVSGVISFHGNGTTSVNNVSNKTSRKAEVEKKREEARKRREERRRLREEQQKANENEESTGAEASETAVADSNSTSESRVDSDTSMKHEVTDTCSPSKNDKVNSSIAHASCNDEEEEDEWSDWDAVEEGQIPENVAFSSKVDIDLESREETLKSCSASSLSEKNGSKVTLLDLARTQGPVADIGNLLPKLNKSSSKTGALKLIGSNTKPVEKSDQVKSGTTGKNSFTSRDQIERAGVKNDLSSSKKKTSRTIEAPRSTDSAQNKLRVPTGGCNVSPRPLGAEFDILSLEFKGSVPKQDIDFFSDMTPNIRQKPQILVKSVGEEFSTATTSPPLGSRSLFAAPNADEVSGWGDGEEDITWDNI